jgi:hypothetical protein
MQRQVLKIVGYVLGILLMASGEVRAQITVHRLQEADSLYQQKKFTQSAEHYESILGQHEFTPAMLLKLAYIKEGLNQVGQALYYLNLYYLATNDKSVLTKMEELASRYNLVGYESTDADRVLAFYQDYHFYITVALAAIVVFLVSLTFSIRRKGQRPILSGIFTVVLLLAFFVHLNWGQDISLGIIGSSNTFLMTGPSPGASVVDVVKEGHRLEIVGKKDVWLQVLWNGEVAYIRENNLLPVRM